MIFTSAERFAMTVSARRAGNARITGVAVVKWRRIKIAARESLGVRLRVRICLIAGNMYAREAVTLENVGCVRIRERGVVPVERNSTKACRVMSRRLYAAARVIKCLVVATTGVRRGATVVRALRLVGLWLLRLADAEVPKNR